MGQTDVVTDMEELGAIEEGCTEWQDGVLRAERPAERAMCNKGTGGRESRVLWVVVKRCARVDHREGE